MEFPLSAAQLGMWHVYRSAPENSVYHVCLRARVLAGLDIPALTTAVQGLVDRHPALRTTFTQRGDDAVQVVHPTLAANVLVRGPASDAEVARVAAEPFDLGAESPLRVVVFGDAELLFVFHHIAWDFESIVVALRDLGELYRAARAGIPPSLPDPAPAYTDYQRWERDWLRTPEAGEAMAYWTETLGRIPEATELPTDRERGPLRSLAGATHQVVLGRERTALVDRRARELGTNKYPLLLAVFVALVGRLSGQRHVTLGGAGSQRNLTEFRGTVGNFVNPFVLHAEVRPDMTLEELVRRCGAAVFRSLRHRILPFPHIVEHLRPDYDPSRAAYFDVLFVYDKAHGRADDRLAAFVSGAGTVDLGGLVLRGEQLPCVNTMYDLTTYIFDSGEDMSLRWEYHTEILDAGTVAGYAEAYLMLLDTALAAPGTSLARLVAPVAGHVLGDHTTVRGYPVEFDRVRRILTADEAVGDACVGVRYRSGPQLVAWVVPAEGAELQPSALRARLRTRVPGYLVPAGIVVTRDLPADPDAVDVPDPAWGDHQEPSSPIEEEIAVIWAGLLGVEQVSVTAHFFDIGGHSLLAAKVAAAMSAEFGVAVTARDVFGAPTVESQARLVLGRLLDTTDGAAALQGVTAR